MKFDVAVIGAGAAGLAAARALSGAGKRVCLIEARERAGGRVHTLHLPDLPVPIELGAEFLHGDAPASFDIVDAGAIPVAELPDDHWSSRDGEWTRIEDFWGQIDRVRARIGALRRDISFDAFLRRHRSIPQRLRELACNFVEGYHAAHANRISARVLRIADQEQDSGSGANRQFRLPGGYDALIAWLRAGLDPHVTELRLGSVAKCVQWSEGSVAVDCSNGRLLANAAVITIPIGVWKDGALRFDPPLKEKERALEKIEAGHVVKIVFRFRERFWEEQRQWNFVHTPDRYMPTWWTMAPLRAPVLTGWAGGHAADAMLADRPAMMEHALSSLSRAAGVPRKRIDSLLAGSWTHDWQSDPYSRGAYSYAAVGGENAHALLARPVRSTLFFAGEATSGDQTGTVAGAIESGLRAARELTRASRSR